MISLSIGWETPFFWALSSFVVMFSLLLYFVLSPWLSQATSQQPDVAAKKPPLTIANDSVNDALSTQHLSSLMPDDLVSATSTKSNHKQSLC